MIEVSANQEELLDRARKELKEDQERIDDCIEHIRNWIDEQPHLHLQLIDEVIVKYLRGSKYDMEETKKKIDLYYSIRTKFPQWFGDPDPCNDAKMRELIKLGIVLPLKEPDNDGNIVFIFRQGVLDTEKYSFNDFAKCVFLISDIAQTFNDTCMLIGAGFIIDMQGLTMQHVLQYTPNNLKNILHVWQNAYPITNKYWYIIHAKSMFQIIYEIGKVFMKKELKHKIKLYDSNLEKVYKVIPKKILPNEYGGEAGTISEIADEFLQFLDSKRDWIVNEAKNTVDESKRPK